MEYLRRQEDSDEVFRKILVFIITDKVKVRRGGGRRCQCYERRGLRSEEIETSHTLGGVGMIVLGGSGMIVSLTQGGTG